MSANEKQVGGSHYKMAIEPWDAIHSWDLGYFDGTAVKYLARWQNKNGVQDLEKAKHFIEKLIEIETGEDTEGVNPFELKDPSFMAEDKLVKLYHLFEDMHQHAKEKHNHYKVAANIVKRSLEEVGLWVSEEYEDHED